MSDQVPGSYEPAERAPRRRRSVLLLVISVLMIAILVPIGFLSLTGSQIRLPDGITRTVETRLNSRIENGRLSLGQVEFVVERGLIPRAQIRDVGVYDRRGSEVARLNEVRIHLSKRRLLTGRLQMKGLDVSGAQITIRRSAGGQFDLSFGAGAGASGDLAGVLDTIDRAFAAEPLADLDSLDADQLTITLEDARSGRLWQVTEGRIELVQSPDSLELTLTADVFNGTEELATTEISFQTQKGSPEATLRARFANAAAADIAAQSPALSFLSVLRAPISGALNARIDETGEVAGFSGALVVGPGALQPTPNTPPIKFDTGRANVSYDPDAALLRLSEVSFQSEAARLTAEGQALLMDFRAGWPATLVGQFSVADVQVQPTGVFAEPMQFDSGAIDLRVRLDPFVIDIGQAALQHDDRRFHSSGRIRALDDGWDISLDLGLNKIGLDRLLALWPVAAVPNTREWIEKNVFAGNITDLSAAFRQAPGEKPNVSINYLFDGARVRFMKSMPVIEDGAGYASLSGTTFTKVVEAGHVKAPQGGQAEIAGTVFRVLHIGTPDETAEVELRSDSTATATLSLLDFPPFELMQKAELPVDIAEGRLRVGGDIRFRLLKDIKIDDVTFRAEGLLSEFFTDRLIEGRELSADALVVRTDNDGVAISGDARFGDLPVNFTWAQEFGPEHKDTSRIEGNVELSPAFLEEFNIDLPPGALSGSGVARLEVDLVKGTEPSFSLVSDLNRVGVALDVLDWSKPRNQTGTLEIAGRMGSTPAIDRLVFRAPGLSVSGAIEMSETGALDTAQFENVQVGGWLDGPVTLTGRGQNAPMGVAVTGGSIDLRNASLSSGDSGGDSGPLSLALDSLTVSEGIVLTGFRGEFLAGSGLNGQFTARVNGQTPISGTIVPTRAGAAIRIFADNAGGALASAGILRNARGGRMDLTLVPTGDEGVYDGRLRISNTRIVEAPALTELLSAISIVGLLDQMNSGGITLADVDAEFRLTPERLTLYRSSAVGPSLGISLDGLYDMKNNQMDMQGVISPVYFLNGIGQIFSRGREGLFGFNFRLRGAADDPRVSVNPLSILTPGAFREIFRSAPPTRE